MGWVIVPDRSKDMAVHAVLMPGGGRGRILYYGGYSVDDTHLFDVEGRTVGDISAAESPGYNIFCSGHAWLGDGRVLIAGGQLVLFTPNGTVIDPPPDDDPNHPHGGMGWGGERRAAIFSPIAGAWQPAEPMHLDPAGKPESGGRWYPTLVTLADGEVLAVGGHPDRREQYPAAQPYRHSNSTPERYSPTSGLWTLLATDPPAENQLTADDGVADYDYQRNHLLPSGHVFFASPVRGANRRYDPYAGVFEDTGIGLPADPMYQGVWAAWTSVMLPLLHQEGFRPRVLVMGGVGSAVIDLGAAAPQWQPTPARDWPAPAPTRLFGCPVLLPTGEVFYTGGTATDGNDATKQAGTIHRAETFDPQIDFEAGTYGTGQWHTQSPAEQATVGRHYHGTALLMPDGAVWTAGSNGPSEEGGNNELRIEVFEPDYFGPGRPQITSSPPSIGYGVPFRMEVAPGTDVRRVVLLRCGSVTHSYNPDQRYLSVNFQKLSPTDLLVMPPAEATIAPPGWYMIWVLDASDRPCEWAPFIRITKQKCMATVDVSTYSVHEVTAMPAPKQFDQALFLVYDGFLPDEVSQPTIAIEEGAGEAAPGIEAVLGAPKYEGGAQNKDRQQRVVYPVAVRFTDPDAAFALIPDGETFHDVFFRARMRDYSCDARLTLSLNPNPRMNDGNPHYLSVDLRVFKTTPGASLTAGVTHPAAGASAPFDYVQSVVTAYRDWQGDPKDHPFEQLPTELESNQLALYGEDHDHNRVYNYAFAQVRYRAPVDVNAADVRVFFRLWTTGWTALTYSDPHADSGSYRRHGDGAAAAPLLGITGGEINNVPCFAEPRVGDMTAQQDDTNLLPLLEGKGEEEVHAYFGCWLDMNDEVKRFPLAPGSATGPFGGELLSIQELMRGPHQCLVAEIHYTPDPIQPGADPGSSDNLAQRNILFDESDNPGGFPSHVVHHTFELKPSKHGLGSPIRDTVATAAAGKPDRTHPDELCIDWGNLPRDSHVTLYMPQLDVDAIVRWSSQRPGPGNLEVVGPGTLRCRVTDVGFVPLPGPLEKNIASLMSVQLPPGVKTGQRFHVVLRQVDGQRSKVVGASRFAIRVMDGAELLPRLERRLSVLMHVFEAIPQGNRWYPVFERYLGELRERVRALGGDPERVRPSSAGNPEGDPAPRPDDYGRGPASGPGSGRPKGCLWGCFAMACRLLERLARRCAARMRRM